MRQADGSGSDEVFEVAPDPGLFTWDVERNIVFADAAVAELFGLEADKTLRGLPLQSYLERVHPDDRAALAKTISDTIVAEIPQQSTYRVQDRSGAYAVVAAFGRAFRAIEGSPVLYSGIVVPAPDDERLLPSH